MNHIVMIIMFLLLGCQPQKAETEQPFAPNRVAAFDFGSGQAAEGFVKVSQETLYSKVNGYGVVSEKPLVAISRNGSDPLRNDFLTSDKPFYFEIDLPEGNYRVKVHLGDPKGQSLTTVKAESRRLMLKVLTENGMW